MGCPGPLFTPESLRALLGFCVGSLFFPEGAVGGGGLLGVVVFLGFWQPRSFSRKVLGFVWDLFGALLGLCFGLVWVFGLLGCWVVGVNGALEFLKLFGVLGLWGSWVFGGFEACKLWLFGLSMLTQS